MEKIKRVACYCRVSTDEQAKHGYSIQAQKDKLQDYVEEHSDMMLVDFYIDDGVSAVKVGKRLELQRLLSDVKERKIDMILFTKLDRWGRSVGIYYQIQSVLDEYGVIWKATDEDYEIETSAGKFKVNIMMSVAQQERDRCSERIRDVFEHKIKAGEAIIGNGSTPVGFKIENKKIIHDQYVSDLIDYYYTFRSLRRTMEYSLEKYDRQIEMRTLQRLFKNPLLYGSYRGNDNFCDPYITKEKFDELQSIIANNITGAHTGRVYIFSKLIKCPHCARFFSGTPHKTKISGHEYVYAYYRCSSSYAVHRACDYRKQLSERKFERQLLSKLDHFMTEYIVDCEVKSEEKAKSKKRSESAIRKEMYRLNDMYLKGRISVEIYDSKYEQLEDELKDSSQSKIKPSDAVLGLQGVNLQELYGTFSDDEKSAFWHGLIKEIRIDDSFNIIDIIFND